LDISLILKIAGVGIIVTCICQMLSKAGRDEQATYVSLAGIIVALMILVGEIAELFELVKDVFGL
jgi:stage III sporulation protein AC